MEYFTRKYDNQLLDIGSCENEKGEEENGFYSNFPQMLPWIGENYDNGIFKKLLLIGESHYLPEDVDESLLNIDEWYNNDHSPYYSNDDEIFAYTNTREIINAGHWSSKGHSIYREPNKIIEKFIKEQNPTIDSNNYFSYVAYYNYFLRPAKKGKSIKDSIEKVCQDKPSTDEKIASDTFKELIGIIKPDAVFFLSKYAFENYKKNVLQINIPVGFSSHPACSWWNRISYHSDGLTGKEKFEHFLRSNKIF